VSPAVRDSAIDVAPFGDAALLVTLGNHADPELTRQAHAVAAAIEGIRASTPGLGLPIPAHASVLVPLDALELDRAAATAAVAAAAREARASEPHEPAPTEPIEIHVRYGGTDGPDLDEVAARVGLSPEDVVELHASARYVVLFLGFAPGFAYLGGLPEALVTPRRATPRQRVVAGTVAIAGGQTAIYPLSMPGGWNLIGRTEARLFDPTADPPARLSPGAVVRFVPAT
jgi:KipI family sensor histidine kinase inhibitor